MSRIFYLGVCVLLMNSPAYAANTVPNHSQVHQGPAHEHNVQIHKRTAQKRSASQVHANMPAVRTPPSKAAALPNTATLTGRLTYQEIEWLEPNALAGIQTESVEAPATIPELTLRPEIAIEQPARALQVRCLPVLYLVSLLKALTLDHIVPNQTADRCVSDMTEAESSQIAESIAAYLADLVPAQETVLRLAPVPLALSKIQRHNPLTQALTDSLTGSLTNSLRKQGFGLLESKQQSSQTKVLRYQVNAIDGGVWIQIQFNHTQANRFYCLDASNGVAATAPFTVREVR